MCAGHCIKKVTYFSLNPHDSSTMIPILQKRKTKVSTKSKVLFLSSSDSLPLAPEFSSSGSLLSASLSYKEILQLPPMMNQKLFNILGAYSLLWWMDR